MHDCLCEEQGYRCTVTVFLQLKLIVKHSDILSKSSLLYGDGSKSVKGGKDDCFTLNFCQAILHLLIMEKSGKFIVTNE